MDRIVKAAVLITCVIVSAFVGSKLWARPPADRSRKPPVENIASQGILLDVAGAPYAGAQKPKVVVVEFSDFECPFCGQYARSTFQEVWREFVETKKIGYAFRNKPLQQIHPRATAAAAAAVCADRSDSFWKLRTLMFANQSALEQSDLVAYAKGIGIEEPAFQECLSGGESLLAHDRQQAQDLGVASTPTFIVATAALNGQYSAAYRIVGAQSADTFRRVINEVLLLR